MSKKIIIIPRNADYYKRNMMMHSLSLMTQMIFAHTKRFCEKFLCNKEHSFVYLVRYESKAKLPLLLLHARFYKICFLSFDRIIFMIFKTKAHNDRSRNF